MKKLMLILVLLLGSLSFVACSKKKDDNNSCQGYPAGYLAVTDQRMLQYYQGSGNYNGSYGGNYGGNYGNNYGNNNGYYNGQTNGVICVDQYTYQQLQQQAYGNGNNGGTNCQMYPSAPECSGNGGNPGSGDPYCDYYPEDPYCWGAYRP